MAELFSCSQFWLISTLSIPQFWVILGDIGDLQCFLSLGVISVRGRFGGYQFGLSVADISFRSVFLISQFVDRFDISVCVISFCDIYVCVICQACRLHRMRQAGDMPSASIPLICRGYAECKGRGGGSLHPSSSQCSSFETQTQTLNPKFKLSGSQ